MLWKIGLKQRTQVDRRARVNPAKGRVREKISKWWTKLNQNNNIQIGLIGSLMFKPHIRIVVLKQLSKFFFTLRFISFFLSFLNLSLKISGFMLRGSNNIIKCFFFYLFYTYNYFCKYLRLCSYLVHSRIRDRNGSCSSQEILLILF